MKLLLHACCADCLLKFVDSIKQENTNISDIVVYFYNPNIHPRSEYLSRLKAIQKICQENKIKIIVPDWSPREWFKTLRPTDTSLDREALKQNSSIFRTAPFDPPKASQSWRAGERETLKKTRCEKCWELRLGKTFEYAKKMDLSWCRQL